MKEKLKVIIQNVLKSLNIQYELDIIVEVPNQKENGDFSTNIALILAKNLKKNPLEIAEMIVSKIEDENIVKVEVKAPGFINFFVDKNYLKENINKILNLGKDYGRNNIGSGRKINVEFVSANPTGIIHMGNARGGAYGDNLARILEFCGYDVTKEYYVNDAGNQINNLGLSIKARYQEALGIPFQMPEEGYFGNDIVAIGKNLVEKYKDTLLDKDLEFFKEHGIEILLTNIKSDLKEYGVEFDVFSSEKAIREKGNLKTILEKLKVNGYTYESEGAIWLKATAFGDAKDHVLVKSDGSYTYLVPDIEYHIDKISRGFDELIDVFGTDHHGYVPRLKASIQALGYNKDILDVKLLQLVRLLKDGTEVRMSKRTGNSVTLKELLDEVGVNAARYFFASRSLDTQMDFDLDLAKKKSNENPVYYISYAYARICTILRENNHDEKIEIYESLNTDSVYNILEKISLFEDITKDAAIKKMPHLIANYVYELANLFHVLYENHRIITNEHKKTAENINLIKIIKITLENALYLIGVNPPERM